MNKPTILVDMDGPLADFDGAWWRWVTERGFRLDAHRETQTHRFATDHLILKRDVESARAVVNQTRWFRDLPVVEGAVVGLNDLAEWAKVYVCTKPLEANAWCRDDKAWWLAEHFGEQWLQRLIITPDKGMVQGDILLDDAPKLKWLDYASWTPVMFPTPWNGVGTEWDGIGRWDWTQTNERLWELGGLA